MVDKITLGELKEAIKEMKAEITPGNDQIMIELIKKTFE